MARSLPTCPAHKPEVSYSNTIERTYAIEVITPLFGGGVEAGVNDPVTLIRPSAIRGHLRFWWRATCGRLYKKVQDLRMTEAAIWGSTEFPSPASLSVTTRGKKPSPETCQVDIDNGRKLAWAQTLTGEDTNKSVPGYVLFPFQGRKKRHSTENEIDPKKFIPSLIFVLNVSFPDDKKYQSSIEATNRRRRQKNQPPLPKIENLQQQIGTAVWAWVNFGGIGARTRRGCGALFCDELAPESVNDLAAAVARYLGENWESPPDQDSEWPVVALSILAGRDESFQRDDPFRMWSFTASLLWKFRQGTPANSGVGRDDGYNDPRRPGMSRWPEAEVVRRLVLAQRKLFPRPTKWHDNARFVTTPVSFPRAELGLPIILEIKDEYLPESALPYEVRPKPLKPTVQRGEGESGDRLASPVILRPLRFKGGRREVPLLLVLHTPRLIEVYLKPGDTDLVTGERHPVRMSGTPPIDCPLSGRTTKGSAVEAFIRYAVENGWTPIGGSIK